LPGPRARLAALVGAWLLAACGCGREPAPSETAPAAGVASTRAPASGTGALQLRAGRVSVARDEVLQLALLEELAGRAGFELEVGSVAPRSIRVRLDDVPLLDAISVVLEGTPFRAAYAVDPKTGAHVLARLSVGEPAPSAPGAGGGEGAATESEGKARAEKLHALLAQRRETAEERARLAIASAEERRAREAEAIEQLADTDAERRVDALAAIDPAGDAAARVVELAKSDPDPRVRAAAVERLGDADTYQATTVLLDSLADPSPQVVIAALEALEYSGDHSLIARIEPLAKSPNPAVREAANSTLESLR
jgi:hypothetical protein